VLAAELSKEWFSPDPDLWRGTFNCGAVPLLPLNTGEINEHVDAGKRRVAKISGWFPTNNSQTNLVGSCRKAQDFD
jgi:hypothetical protein